MLEVLQGEFFWGVVVGLLLSFFGSWALAKFTVAMQQTNAKRTITRFCIDALRNIQSIIAELDVSRDRAKAIHHDFLTLVEIEVQIYGRNREHLIHLPDEERSQVRKFMNDVAIKRAEVANKLDQFYQANRLADQIQVEGRGPEAQRVRENGALALRDAQVAADRLVSIASGAPSVIDKLSRVR